MLTRLNGRNTEQRRAALLRVIQRNPGVTLKGLHDQTNPAVFERYYRSLLAELIASGEVFVHHWPWSQNEFFYPKGHDLSKLFEPARSRMACESHQTQTEIKAAIDRVVGGAR